MMVMTAKFNFKKILMILGGIAAVVLALILLLGGGDEPATEQTGAPAVSGNEERIQFLKEMGWEVDPEPVQSGRVKISKETSAVYERYNNLQKSQGYDLSKYAGKKCMRYVYKVKNYPGATDPVYATILICKDQIIGGDITDTSAGGKIQGFRKSGKKQGQKTQAPTASTEAAPSAAPTQASEAQETKAEAPQ